MPDKADVAIIGGGLAGCAAAIALGRTGIRPVVFEKGRPFKDKACGDAFMPSAIAILNDLGLSDSDFTRVGGNVFRSIDLFDSSRLLWRHELSAEAGWMLPRRQLDQALRDVAGKTSVIQYEANVNAIIPDGNAGWNVGYETNGHHEMNVRAVILATGADNKLSRTFHIAGEPLPSTSLSAYASGRSLNSLVFQFTDLCKRGYAWIFPLNEEVVNIGICVFAGHVHALKRSAEEVLSRWHFPASRMHWRGGREPLWSGNAKHWHHPNGLVSCGDAAALIDPLNGEGITAALYSGRLAAKHVHGFLDNHLDSQHLTDYSDSIKQFFTQRYRTTLQRVVWKALCKLE
jgi:flavin-dependent dehydrogenase